MRIQSLFIRKKIHAKTKFFIASIVCASLLISGCGANDNQSSTSGTTTPSDINDVSEDINNDINNDIDNDNVEANTTTSNTITPTLTDFLTSACLPLANTLYVWGGGWNEEDTGAGYEAMQYGLSPQWLKFYNEQKYGYDFESHRYEIHNGLDCSGYIGFAMYNTFGNKYSENGYVLKSSQMAQAYASMGLGTVFNEGYNDFEVGDICSMVKHVWICLGKYPDGSALILHASPPGVRICGTVFSDGSKSLATAAAERIMSKHFTEWYSLFPDCGGRADFIWASTPFRFDESVLPDVDNLKSMDPEEMMDLILSKIK